MSRKECYLICWYDPTDRIVKSETIAFDDSLMHKYANGLRVAMGEDFRPARLCTRLCSQ